MRTHCITIDLANQGRHQVRARFDGERRLRERDRGHPLAGSSTLNRLEPGTPEQAPQDRYKRIVADPQRLDALLVELFLDNHAAAPEEIVLDVDGAVEELQRIVGQIRQRWPRVRVVVRGDAGFCRDELMAWCEAAEGVDYVFGLAQNAQPGAGQRAGIAAVLRFPLSGAAAEGGRGGAGERAEGLGVVVLGVSTPGAVRAQPGAVADGDAGIACGPAGETAGAPRAAASGRCVHPAPIRRAGRAECPGTGPG